MKRRGGRDDSNNLKHSNKRTKAFMAKDLQRSGGQTTQLIDDRYDGPRRRRPPSPSSGRETNNSNAKLLATTRVCIKNLPLKYREEDVRALVQETPGLNTSIKVTDCKVLLRRPTNNNKGNSKTKNSNPGGDGCKSRRIAFCGLLNGEQAAAVVKYWNHSYRRGCKLVVEFAATKLQQQRNARTATTTTTRRGGAGSESESPPSSSLKQQHQHGDKKSCDNDKNDNKKEEKMMRRKPKTPTSSKFWSNDDEDEFVVLPGGNTNDENRESDVGVDSTSGAQSRVGVDDVNDSNSTGSSSSSSSDDDDDDSDADDADPLNNRATTSTLAATTATTNKAAAALVSDLDFLRSKQVSVDDLEEEEKEAVERSAATATPTPKATVVAGKREPEDEENDRSSSSGSSGSTDDDDDDSDGDSTTSSNSSRSRTELNKGEETNKARPARSRSPPRTTTAAASKEDQKANANDDENNNDDVDDEEEEEEEDSCRLFVRNLAFTVTDHDLKEVFAPFGTLDECRVARSSIIASTTMAGDGDEDDDDEQRGASKGFAFVRFTSPGQAAAARRALDGTDVQGRILHVVPARPKPAANNDASGAAALDLRGLSYKERQERLRQQRGGADRHRGMLASHVREHAAVDHVASQLGVRQGQVLAVKDGLGAGDAAVRMALAETAVLQQNKDYFASHGIDIDALVNNNDSNDAKNNGTNRNNSGGTIKPAAAVKRSKTKILVKNLPADTAAEELVKAFSAAAGAAPDEVLLPPSRTIAVLKYAQHHHAKRAMQRLAYRRFRTVPLYLEWAPLLAQHAEEKTNDDNNNNNSTNDKHKNNNDKVDDASKQEQGEHDDDDLEDNDTLTNSSTRTIYVKNLNFCTTEEQLAEAFAKHSSGGSVRSVRIPQKVAPVQTRLRQTTDAQYMRQVSMGFGFVEFESSEAARSALRTMQGTTVDGHALELSMSKGGRGGGTASGQQHSGNKSNKKRKKNPTKLMVRNVPFQANRGELLKLFGHFGHIKKIRLPKKFHHAAGRQLQHRGFAFVEFLAHREALDAMETLANTHLYGRHLVMEWADPDDDDNEN